MVAHTPPIANFVARYTEADRARVVVTRELVASEKGEPPEVRDVNRPFRWEVARYCIQNSDVVPAILLEHLFLADAEWSSESVPDHFIALSECMLRKCQLDALVAFSAGHVASFDTRMAGRFMQLPKDLLANLVSGADSQIATATNESVRINLMQARKLFELLSSRT